MNWSHLERRLFGDISCAAAVKAYDNAQWKTEESDLHHPPLDVNLLFVPGISLKNYSPVSKVNPKGEIELAKTNTYSDLPDIDDLFSYGVFNKIAYLQLYANRLMPVLRYANEKAKASGQKAVITLQSIGCGEKSFALREKWIFHQMLRSLLLANIDELTHINTLYYDSYIMDAFNDGLRSIRGNKNELRLLTGAKPCPGFKVTHSYVHQKTMHLIMIN